MSGESRNLSANAPDMSILMYFTREGSNTQGIILPSREESGVFHSEYVSIVTEVQSMPQVKRKRKTYREGEKIKIAKYADSHGTVNAIKHFRQDFPNLTESTLRPWVAKYRLEARKTSSSDCSQISEKRGRPLLLPDELDRKLRVFIVSTRTAGGTINKHVIYGILMGLIKSDLGGYGQYLNFVITNVEGEIPDELILNVDQTPSRFVPTDNVTIAEKSSKHVSRKGSSDKRGITVTLAETLSGQILPFQLIYTGKTSRSLPHVEFPAGFCLSYNEKHWSNEAETMALVNKIIYPYVAKVKEELGLPETQKALLVWDAFKAQSTEKVSSELERLNINVVALPKNMTHLLQPLDLTTNASVKKMEKRGFSDYFTSTKYR
ncbi:hypothetical protein AWC38_SpisGene8728 [Stylophora pistillata]|uniref:DDE-1 domain-containing protein n=1 Tax=Stylophora pistillata TaxID=50429 RepID=A0A2B4SBY6_STYPI|nr:hypothetical protein AWC38_SpisGene8728 [Stylophora pistillata]